MKFSPNLAPGQVLVNQELCELFKCSPQGGMRRSKTTNTLVIISNHVTSIYDDRWLDDVFYYTGMGMDGDQSLEFAQNKTLAGLATNNVDAYLFEVFCDKEYTYVGRAVLAGAPYAEKQLDQNGNERRVWMFPLKLADNATLKMPAEVIRSNFERKAQKVRKLSDAELKRRAILAAARPGNRRVAANQYDRDPSVSEYAKRIAKGTCQLCGNSAPFKDKVGAPFLETHHIVWLSKGGEDSIYNTVALCPNCHRRMHVLDADTDRVKLMAIARA